LTVDDTMYDLAAKAEGEGAPTNDEMPVYALVVGKNRPKLKESAPDADPWGHTGVSGRNYVVTMPKATMGRLVRQNAEVEILIVDHVENPPRTSVDNRLSAATFHRRRKRTTLRIPELRG
jgi:hypothetical protein